MRRIRSAEAVPAVAAVLFGVVLFLLLDVLILSRFLVDEDRFEIDAAGERGWYTLKPHSRGESYGWGTNFYPLSTDALGYRIDPSHAPTRPAEFIFLGDSSTFGVNGPWEETFVGMFEQASRRAVINAGVSSYSPTVYLYQYKAALAAGVLRKPHTVVVGIDISDVQDEAAFWQDGDATPERREGSYMPERSRVRATIASHFLATRRIYRFLRNRDDHPSKPRTEEQPPDSVYDQGRSAFTWRNWNEVEKLSRGYVDIRDPHFYDKWGYGPLGVQGGLDRITAKLQATADVARENQGSLWILIYPWPAQLKYGSAVFDWEAFTHDLCAKIACRGVIDMFPIFRRHAETHPDWYRRLFVWGDTHFNKTGNRMIADELIRVLLDGSRP